MVSSINYKNRILEIIIIIILFISALTIRLGYHANTVTHHPIRADAKQYFFTAYNVINYGIYSSKMTSAGVEPLPDRIRPPGFPLLLMPLIKISDSVKVFIAYVHVMHSLLGALITLLVYFIARIYFNIYISIIPSTLTMLSPHLISMEQYILTETVFTFFLYLSIYILYKVYTSNNLIYTISCSFIFLYLILIKPIALMLPMIYFAIYFFKKINTNISKREIIKHISIYTLMFSFMYGGYIYFRNMVPDAPNVTNQSLLVHITAGSDINLESFLEMKINKGDKYDEWMESSKNLKEAKNYVKDKFINNPYRSILWYAIGKFYFSWKWNSIYIGDVYTYPMKYSAFKNISFYNLIYKSMKYIHNIIFYVSLLSFFYLVLCLPRKKERQKKIIFYILILYYFYFYLIFSALLPLPRYSIPLRPIFYILSTFIIVEFYKIIVNKIRLET